MKKRMGCLLCAILILSCIGSAFAEAKVYYNVTPPDDWQERDLLRLIVFKTTLNAAMLLEYGGDALMVDGAMDKYANVLMDAYAGLGYNNTADGHVYVPKIFNTHPHDDHLLGIYRLIRKGMTTDLFLTSFLPTYRNEMHQKAIKEFEGRGIPIHYLAQNEQMRLGSAMLTFFWYAGGKDPNELSCCTRVEFGNASLLLTGDAVGNAQKGLLEQQPPEMLKADILKAPHHSYTVMVKEFLDAVSPQLVFTTNWLTSTQDTARQVERRNAIFLSHAKGRIVAETDGEVWYVTQYPEQV